MPADDLESEASGTPPPPDPNNSPDAGGAPGGGGPPGSDGPDLAMIAKSRQGPQPSAPGPGDSASSMSKMLSAVKLIQQAAIGLPPGSPLHKDAMRAVTTLSRHLPQGAPTAGVQMTGLRDLMRQVMQSGFLQNILQQRGGQGAPGGGGGGAQQPPIPSLPLPGA